MRRVVLLVLSWSLVLLCMAVIFALSHETASVSQEKSDGVITLFLERFGIHVSSYVIRKTAHALEYCGLSALLYFAYFQSFRTPQAALTLLTGVLYATSDEIHQYFIVGRACQLRDVFVDFLGALGGVAACSLLYGFYRLYEKKRDLKWQC